MAKTSSLCFLGFLFVLIVLSSSGVNGQCQELWDNVSSCEHCDALCTEIYGEGAVIYDCGDRFKAGHTCVCCPPP
ncbi:hypothetical protein C5167_037603 [Papaver somniferum]|uniref:Defensin-like protein n=1 Tax=Papaver somniferum TaxID=3469 RepID=A0A4Y7I9D2_PAPSO|nr:hypothetical protein C5167_037603 [Papaver somniferum]